MKSVRRLMVLVIDVQIGLGVSDVIRNFHEWRTSVNNNNVIVRFTASHNADYYTVEYRTDGDWMMDATRYPHNTQHNQQMVHITVEYTIDYDIRVVPWKDDFDQPGEPSQVFAVFTSCDQAPG